MNEAYRFSVGGYEKGNLAPGRCSSWEPGNCSAGNSATEPYIVGHNLLLAHATAVRLYKNKYQVRKQAFDLRSVSVMDVNGLGSCGSNMHLDHRPDAV